MAASSPGQTAAEKRRKRDALRERLLKVVPALMANYVDRVLERLPEGYDFREPPKDGSVLEKLTEAQLRDRIIRVKAVQTFDQVIIETMEAVIRDYAVEITALASQLPS